MTDEVMGVQEEVIETPEPEVDFDALVLALAQKRAALDEVDKLLTPLANKKKVLKKQEEDAYKALAEASRRHFEETGEKKPHDAVLVRMDTRTEYPIEENLGLIHRHAPQLIQISVDMSAFKNLIKAGHAPWAKAVTTQEYKPFIQQKLGEYIIQSEAAVDSGE